MEKLVCSPQAPVNLEVEKLVCLPQAHVRRTLETGKLVCVHHKRMLETLSRLKSFHHKRMLRLGTGTSTIWLSCNQSQRLPPLNHKIKTCCTSPFCTMNGGTQLQHHLSESLTTSSPELLRTERAMSLQREILVTLFNEDSRPRWENAAESRYFGSGRRHC